MRNASFVILAIAAFTLAGCGDPPSGAITGDAVSVPIDGVARIEYQAAVNPLNDTTGGVFTQCPPPEAPPQYHCRPAASSIHVHLASAPDPGPAGYHLWGVGVGPAKDFGAVAPNGTGYSLDYSEAADLTGAFDLLELRIDSFVVAQASAQAGPSNKFDVLPANLNTKVEGTFAGPDLTMQVSGLPNGTFTGFLYLEQDGQLVRQSGFPVTNGEVKYTAERNVAEYKDLHIHAGTSMVNIYKATIGA